MTLLDDHPRSPFRPPDWRWRRAAFLHGEGLQPSRRYDDPAVRRTLAFRKTMARCADDPEHPKLARADSALLAAYRLRLGPEPLTWEIEARVLADQPAGAIEARTGIPRDVIEAYEVAFYSARERLAHRDWITAVALGPRLFGDLTEADIGLVLKLYAYHGGPLVLDAMLDAITDNPAHVTNGQDDDARRLSESVRMAIAVRMLPTAVEAVPFLPRVFVRLLELDRAEATRSATLVLKPVVAAPIDVAKLLETTSIVRADGANEPEIALGVRADGANGPEIALGARADGALLRAMESVLGGSGHTRDEELDPANARTDLETIESRPRLTG